MCTVTYLPNENGHIITSNRDEDPKRRATPPESKDIDGHIITFPKDPFAGGTWFATDSEVFTLVILNGGFEAHEHQPPYRRSRGLLLLDFFEVRSINKFTSGYDFQGIEPFTLLIIKSDQDPSIDELVWNEKELHHQTRPGTEPIIWSSSSLYPKNVREERKTWFTEWMKNRKTFTQEDIIDFHKHGGKGDAWNDFVMNRNGQVQTVSVTSLEVDNNQFGKLYHEDLQK